MNFNKKFRISIDLKNMCKSIEDIGGSVIIVGGCLRDKFISLNRSDVDMEIYGVSFLRLRECLKNCGFSLINVGNYFSILKIHKKGKNNILFDLSLPRIEKKIKLGHNGFGIFFKKNLLYKNAAKRRDYTINAFGFNFKLLIFLDPYNGVSDLNKFILKNISEKFTEDPLRVFRGCQFVGRFIFFINRRTLLKCKLLKNELRFLSKERIGIEFEKILLSKIPSLALETLRVIKALDIFVELKKLKKDLFKRDIWPLSLIAIDYSSIIIYKKKLSKFKSLIIIYSILCCSFLNFKKKDVNNIDILYKLYNKKGILESISFLDKMNCSKKIINNIYRIVKEFRIIYKLCKNRKFRKNNILKKLSIKVDLVKLCIVAKSIFFSIKFNEIWNKEKSNILWLEGRIKCLNLNKNVIKCNVTGDDILREGYCPGKKFGKFLKIIFNAQLNEKFKNSIDGISWIKKNIGKFN